MAIDCVGRDVDVIGAIVNVGDDCMEVIVGEKEVKWQWKSKEYEILEGLDKEGELQPDGVGIGFVSGRLVEDDINGTLIAARPTMSRWDQECKLEDEGRIKLDSKELKGKICSTKFTWRDSYILFWERSKLL